MNRNKEGEYLHGQYFFYGLSVRKNYRKAFPFLLEAAQAGYAHAQNLVGYCFNLGLGTEKNLQQAMFWYRRAAKHYHPEALYNLATLYEKGVAGSQRQAFNLYLKAAQIGDAWSQCNVGVCYMDGTGTKQDFVKAVEWYRKAARKGDSKAQYNLGLVYRDGEGVKRSDRLSKLWFTKAAAQGHRKALRELRDLEKIFT